MRIAIVTTKTPFVTGGAESHAAELRAALERAGHEAEIVAFPFKWYPPQRVLDHILACRLLDLEQSDGRPIDLAIGLKFPAYLAPHPRKVLWILHQYRQVYELWNSRWDDLAQQGSLGLQVREAVRAADRKIIPEARRVFANSRRVAERLRKYCGIPSTPLYHPPPGADSLYTKPAEDYLFFPSRISPLKRQLLVIEALRHTKSKIRVFFSGPSDSVSYASQLQQKTEEYGLKDRVRWLGNVAEEEKRDLYARSAAVVYTPFDEDLGYVTLEAMLSHKPVITCEDSGGTLEFVQDGITGLITPPAPQELAAAFDNIAESPARAAAMGAAGFDLYQAKGISWNRVVEELLS
jgi:glycosyltransferase involved in cell wall biosynthesis